MNEFYLHTHTIQSKHKWKFYKPPSPGENEKKIILLCSFSLNAVICPYFSISVLIPEVPLRIDCII